MRLNNSNVKQATSKDYKRLKEIGMNCYDETVAKNERGWLSRILFLRYFSKRKFLERERLGVFIYCIEENNEIVGFYELEPEGCLSSLYVHTDYQKKGYGKKLLTHAFMIAKQQKMKEIHLDASRFAHHFYQHMGFKDTKKPRIILGVWMVAMKKEIS